jgi:hypothetical protein
MGNSGVSLEDQNAKRNMDSKDFALEVSDGKKNSIGNWTRSHSCYAGKEVSYILSMP